MGRYVLVAGSWLEGAGTNRKKYNHAKENIVESDKNLAAIHPEKFRPLIEEGPFEYNPNANRKSDVPAQPPPITATTALRTDPKGKNIDEQYGNLDALNINDLKQIAEAEEIALPKNASKKEEIIKILRSHGKA